MFVLGPLTDLPLARTAVDRDAEARVRPELFDELAANPATRVLPLVNGTAPMNGTSLDLRAWTDVHDAELLCYLGRTVGPASNAGAGTPVVLAVLSEQAAAAVDPAVGSWMSLRESGPLLSDGDAALMTAAVALANFHGSHGHCPRCGTQTESTLGGWMRLCPQCQNQVFPRTDPAVIVLVRDDDDRLLLGSNILWPEGRYSLLAGFVEAGEGLEQAVCREIAEESGLDIEEPLYLGSQPWPFPRSMMLGFSARVAVGQDPDALQPDGEEIVDLRWLSREQLRAEAGTLLLPGPTSIARSLIELWLVADGGPGIDESAQAAEAAAVTQA